MTSKNVGKDSAVKQELQWTRIDQYNEGYDLALQKAGKVPIREALEAQQIEYISFYVQIFIEQALYERHIIYTTIM